MALKEQFRHPPLTDGQISRLIELIDAQPVDEELGFIRGVLSETLRVAQEQAKRGKQFVANKERNNV